MICPNCQKEIPDNVKACGYCGHWLGGTEGPPPPASPARGFPWIWTGIGLAILIVAVGLIAFPVGRSGGRTETENAPSSEAVDVAATVTAAIATEQAKAAISQPTEEQPTESASPTITSEFQPTGIPTPELTSTPTAESWDAAVTMLTYLRREPDFSAAPIAGLKEGDQVNLVAVTADQKWVQAKTADDDLGWLEVRALDLNVSLEELEVVEVATVPTLIPNPTNTAESTSPPPSSPTPHPISRVPDYDTRSILDPVVISDQGLYKMWYTSEDASGTFRVSYATSPDGVTWTKYTGNPVLDLGLAGTWDSEMIRLNTVIKDGNNYQMWYSGNGHQSIGYATSSDGINWVKYTGNPVFRPGSPGSWDGGLTFLASIIKEEEGYKMWYTGVPGADWSGTARLGYATSPDGVTWTRYAGNPILDVGSGWEAGWIIDPYVIWNGTAYEMWYSGFDILPVCDGHLRTGYATSPNGISWNKSGANPVLDINPSSWDHSSVTAQSIIFNGSTYQMWYHGGRLCETEMIGFATSSDGLTWTKYDGNPVLRVGQ